MSNTLINFFIAILCSGWGECK